MKLKLEVFIEGFDLPLTASEIEDNLSEAFAAMRWTFCNGGSRMQIMKLCAGMNARGDHETTAEDCGNDWRAKLTITKEA